MSTNDIKLEALKSDRKGSLYPTNLLKETNADVKNETEGKSYHLYINDLISKGIDFDSEMKRRFEELGKNSSMDDIQTHDQYGLPEIGLSYIEVIKPELLHDPLIDSYLNDINSEYDDINSEYEILVDENDNKDGTTNKEFYPWSKLREIAIIISKLE